MKNKRRNLKLSELGGKPLKTKGLPPNFVNEGSFISTRKMSRMNGKDLEKYWKIRHRDFDVIWIASE